MNTSTATPASGLSQSKRRPCFPRHQLLATALAAVLLTTGFAPTGLISNARGQTALPPTAPTRPDRILVKPNPGADLSALHLVTGAQVLRTFPAIGNLQVLRLPEGKLVAEVIGVYQASGLVEYAEPDFIVHALATPNDFRYWDGSLWNLHNTGQLGGRPDADIDAPEAWDIQNTASNIVVAVIDTGLRLTHEDLAANLWVNPGESGTDALGLDKRSNVRDDDGNGFIDDVHGINTLNGTGIPSDDYGHGSHVSGILGAVGNNNVGVVGVAWRVQIMACKFLDATGQGSISDAITCIDYARAKGAKIINASWGGYTFNSAGLRDAIASTRAAGMIFVAACGNDNNDNDVNPLYPASYDLDNIIAVAATTRTDDKATWSNYGATKVHLGAPALDIFSCWNGNDSDYRWFSGTSMGAPHVVGTCALLWTRYPAETYRQIINRVLAGVDPLPALAGKTVTGGRLNLQKALGAPANVVADFTASPASGAAPLTVQFTDTSTGAVASRDWNFGDGTPHSTAQNPTHTYANPGNYTATLTVTGVNGSTSSRSRTISAVANYTVQSTTFAWVDPGGMAAVSLADDGVSAPLALPFTFNFYGRDYSQFYIGANGLIGFSSQSLSSVPNTDLPDSAAPNAIVCPYWADLNPAAGGSVRVGVTGTAPNRRVVVSWVDVPVKGSLVMTRFTFQAVLLEGSNRILCQYLQIEPNRTAGERQAGTVGIENETGTVTAKYTYNESPATLANNSALLFAPTAAARMAVTPGGGVSSAGNQGGPFSPSSQTYTVSSTGSAPLHWSASVNQSWVTLSSTGGTLTPGQTAGVTVSINSQANALTPGTYTATVSFANLDTGEGSTTRDVTLTVNQVASAMLGVIPTTDFASQGQQGGPFSPDSKAYTLTNTGNATLNWTTFKDQAWVSLSATSGTLAPGGSATVTVTINQTANSLSPNTYRARVRFFNTTSSQGNTSRDVTLKVQKRPKVAAGYEPSGALLSTPIFQIQLQGEPYETYAIQTTTNLAGWNDMAVNRADNQGAFTVTDPVASLFKQRFYRGMLVPNPLGPIGTDIVPVFRTDRILVKPVPGGDLTALHLLTGVRVLWTFPAIGNLHVLEVPAGKTVADLLAIYGQSVFVQYAEPDAIVQALATPNDFRFQDGTLWHLHNTGQLGGTPDADIDAPEAWDVQTDATNVVIAVIDTGVRYTHEDLAANMWVNPGEIPGNGVDDDGDGFVDNVHGINAVTGSGNPMDDHGHGTHVSGIMGAVGNNGVGVVGPSWRTRIMALKALDAQGNGAISDAIRCIDFARSRRVQVINASWGTPGFNSAALKDAIASARDADIIFVAACGNSAEDNGVNPVYPASYDLDNIISVAATTRTDALASFSNYGATNVHLGAPGSPIFSCWGSADDAYQYFDGTSMAAALTSGATALCRSRFPNESYRQIINRLLAGTDPLPSLAGKCASGGRLNLQKALGIATPPPLPTVTITATDANAAEPNDTGTFTVTRTGDTSAGLTVSYAIGGTASNGSDYQTLPGSVTISAGSSSATITVTPIDDSVVEGDETVLLTLAASANYSVGSPNSATVTIADNDSAPPLLPTVSVTATDANASEAGPDPGQFTVTRSGSTSTSLTVNYTLGGSAGNGTDYQSLPTSVTIPVGASSATVTVMPINDSAVEGNETVVLTLSGSAAYTIGSLSSAVVTIADNDSAPPPLVADFTASPMSGPIPLPVQFTDKSAGNPVAWSWSFGDSFGSTEQNPSHTYLLPGNFTATLTVRNNAGATSSKSQTIQVRLLP